MSVSAHDRLAENRARDSRGRRAAQELGACEIVTDASGAVSVRCPGAAPDIARLIDHTLLKPDATETQIRALCAEARQHGFATVCVNPTWVAVCAEELAGSDVGVTTVVGFPLGATSTAAKVFEARQAIADGADEIDMVLNIGALKGGDDRRALEDVAAVAAECHAQGALLKVILENGFLTDAEKTRACQICVQAGADYVKTATGFGPGGATPADVALMRAAVGDAAEVKAAGGIRTLADAYAVVKAGATRLGASAGVALVQGLRGESAPAESKTGY
ncbi:MAG: deoxyribose-phosphate aldolase [Anaerolineae bacterium]